MLNQSFRQVFVTNTPNLLASGTTVNLGVGQIGIFDGNTYGATANPTYAKNKALYIGQGQFDFGTDAPLMIGVSSNTELTKLIKGKRITGFRGKKASRGRGESITVGYDGVNVAKTLGAVCGETKVFYLKLSGQPISTMFSTAGLIRQYRVDTGPCADCVTGDANCQAVCAEPLADQLVAKINSDESVNRFVRAKKLVNCTPAQAAIAGTVSNTRYQVTVTDNGDFASLGGIQSQYPTRNIYQAARVGSLTTYEFIQTTAGAAPAPVSNLNNVIINDCPTCPAGYTTVPSGFVHTVRRQDAGTDLTAAVRTDYATTNVSRVNTQFGEGVYIVTRATAITAPIGTDQLIANGQARQSCVLTSAVTTPWVTRDTLTQFPRTYTLTIKGECNTNRLTEVQAAYPSRVVTLTTGVPSDSCAHRYQTVALSAPLAVNCGIDQLQYTDPSAFEGILWEPLPLAVPVCTGCVAGVIIESVFVNRITNEMTYNEFTYEYDGVHIEGSQYNPDYNDSPFDSRPWPTTVLQQAEYPHGDGFWVRKEEEKSKAYAQKHLSHDAGVNDARGYYFNSDLNRFYDEYTIEYSFDYKVLGWSDTYIDSYHLTIYVPEGQGKQIEAAVNGYITSAAVDLDPVVL